jgi:type IX secretion system PorP/SprF family membrane protein
MSITFSGNNVKLKITGLNVIIFVIAFSIFFKNNIVAQDVHFSQFLTTPIYLNPANTGTADEDTRFANNYRNQWSNIDVPFNTLYCSLDKKLSLFNQLFGIGGFIIHDQSSSYYLSTDKFVLSFSYSLFYKNNQFVIGIQPGLVNMYYNKGITFGSQFDPSSGSFNGNLPSGENNLNNKIYYFDLNTGFLWKTHIRTVIPVVGFSIGNLNRPVESFSTGSLGTRLPFKYIFHGQATIPINTKYDIVPCSMFGYTQGAREFLGGAVEGYYPQNFFMPVKKIYIINMFRVNPFLNVDALIIGAGMRFLKLDIAITHDINVSWLHNATNYNGAFEISLIYAGDANKAKNIVEPCYIY